MTADCSTCRDKSRSPDERLAWIAARQHGLLTIRQLREVMSTSTVARWVRRGRLHQVHRGVYSLGHPGLSDRGHLLAAVIAVGGDAVLSHSSAVALWGLLPAGPRGEVHILTTHRFHRRRGIAVHWTRDLPARDVTRLDRIPVTSPARTLLDLADSAPLDILRDAVRQASVKKHADERTLRARLATAHGRRGAARLAQVLNRRTSSRLEDKLLDLLLASDLPDPAVNQRIEGLARWVVPDFLWADPKVIVEADGGRFHGDPVSRQHDAHRQAMLEAAGYRVLRVSWTETTQRPRQTLSRIAQALGR